MLPPHKSLIPVKSIQHAESATMLLGCGSCHLKECCGGLQVEAAVIHCLDFCNCANPDACDIVCTNAPRRFVKRLDEVRGFGLDGIGLDSTIPWPDLPNWIPVLEKPLRGLAFDRLPFAALPIHAACRRSPQGPIALTADELAEKFGGAPQYGWVLSGVDHDRRIEPIWGLGRQGRSTLFAGLKRAGVVAVTSPNFSLMADVPRPDNLHARKRIGIVWAEMNAAGLAAALHVNARTDSDFEFYAQLLRRTGGRAIAFEFATGAASPDAIDRYVLRLAKFAAAIPWRLTILVRGGAHRYSELQKSFETVIQLDTNAHMKARKRQVLIPTATGRGHRWVTDPTSTDRSVGELFAVTYAQCQRLDRAARVALPRSPLQALRPRARKLNLSANDETGQMSLAL
jgi:hypothetical protein